MKKQSRPNQLYRWRLPKQWISALLNCALLLISATLPIAAYPSNAATDRCTIIGNQLVNLRPTPGTNTGRVGRLAPQTQLLPLATGLDGTNQVWFQVQVLSTTGQEVTVGAVGWILPDARWLNCTPAVNTLKGSLPVGAQPANPTNKKVAYDQLPGGRAGGGFDGFLQAEQGMAQVVNDDSYGQISVFRDKFYLRMEINRTQDNRRVRRVEFVVEDSNGDVVYENIENDAGYCLFGGGAPLCDTLQLRPGVTWPGTTIPILNDHYFVSANVYVQGRNGSANWNVDIQFAIPGNAHSDTGASGLVAYLAQTGRFSSDYNVSDELVFQVQAYDSALGTYDGAGIQNVEMWVEDGTGNQIYFNRENSAGYCLFGAGTPDCAVWSFRERKGRWPNGTQFVAGEYVLRALVNAVDGQQTSISESVYIE